MITPRASPLVTFESWTPMLQSKWLPDKLPMNIPTVVPVRFLINLKNTQIERTFYPIICISPPEGVNVWFYWIFREKTFFHSSWRKISLNEFSWTFQIGLVIFQPVTPLSLSELVKNNKLSITFHNFLCVSIHN